MSETLDFSILYVEDDQDIREGLAKYLKRRFREVRTAEHGAVGLEQYSALRPDILITDIQMPVMDGIQMIHKIREKDKKLPVIITSAYTDTEYIVNAIDLNVSYYLKKPIDKNELASALSECLKLANQTNLK